MRRTKVLSFDEVQAICESLVNSQNPILGDLAKELRNEEDIAIAIIEKDEL